MRLDCVSRWPVHAINYNVIILFFDRLFVYARDVKSFLQIGQITNVSVIGTQNHLSMNFFVLIFYFSVLNQGHWQKKGRGSDCENN